MKITIIGMGLAVALASLLITFSAPSWAGDQVQIPAFGTKITYDCQRRDDFSDPVNSTRTVTYLDEGGGIYRVAGGGTKDKIASDRILPVWASVTDLNDRLVAPSSDGETLLEEYRLESGSLEGVKELAVGSSFSAKYMHHEHDPSPSRINPQNHEVDVKEKTTTEVKGIGQTEVYVIVHNRRSEDGGFSVRHTAHYAPGLRAVVYSLYDRSSQRRGKRKIECRLESITPPS